MLNVLFHVEMSMCLLLELARIEREREREREWERMSSLVLLACLAASKEEAKRGVCALSCWLACPAAGQSGSEKRENVLSHVDWSVLLPGGQELGRGWEMVSAAFYVAPGRWPRQNGISYSHWVKYINSNSNGQSNSFTK